MQGNAGPFRVFVSAVTGELGSYRNEVARVLRRREIEVRDQEYFRLQGGTLLDALDHYIRQCDAVVCLVGERSGWVPPDCGAFTDLREHVFYQSDTAIDEASYTQWELVLARHHRKQVYVYMTADGFVPDAANDDEPDARACQAAHRQ